MSLRAGENTLRMQLCGNAAVGACRRPKARVPTHLGYFVAFVAHAWLSPNTTTLAVRGAL